MQLKLLTGYMYWLFRRNRPDVTVLYIKHAKDPGSVADPEFDLRGRGRGHGQREWRRGRK